MTRFKKRHFSKKKFPLPVNVFKLNNSDGKKQKFNGLCDLKAHKE